MSIELRPHNQESYEKVKELLEKNNRAAILDTSGLGKTYRTMKLIEDNPDAKFLYVNIYKVMLHKFKADLIDNGVPYSKKNLNRKTYRGLISLMKQDKLKELTGFDYIVLDEFQICGAPETQKAIEILLSQNPDAKILGLSATPIRFFDDDNARDMAEELFGDAIASEITEEEAQKRGLKKAPIYTVGLYEYKKIVEELEIQIEDCSDEGIKEEAEAELKILREYLDSEVKGLPELLETAMTNKSGKYIVYCKNIEDMEEKMQEAWKMFGRVNPNMTLRCVGSNKNEKSNSKAIKNFDKDNDEKTLKLLFSVDMINLAYHPNEIDGVIMMRPTRSPNLYYCQYGRATSVNNDKQPIIVDLVDNIDTIEIIEGYFSGQLRNETEDMDKKDNEVDSRKINISGKIIEIQEVIKKINGLLRRRNNLTDIEKYKIMMEFVKQAEENGENLKADTIYNGYHIGSWRSNLRASYWETGLPNMDSELLQAFKDAGIIIEEKERKRTTDEEKMKFLMSLVGKTKEEREQTIMELENSSITYGAVMAWLKDKYENGELSDDQVMTLRKNEILSISRKETKEIADKYKIPTRYVKGILKEYRTFEEFLEKYKNGECDYDFDSKVFVGPRIVTISSKEITEKQKQGYYDLLTSLPYNPYFDTEKQKNLKENLYIMDIDEIEYMLSNSSFKERDMEWLRLYYGLDKEKLSLTEISKKYGVGAGTVKDHIDRIGRMLIHPSRFRKSCFVNISRENIEDNSLYLEQIKYYLNEENIFNPDERIPGVEREIIFDDELKETKVQSDDINEDTSLWQLDFSIRTYNCLHRAGINTVKDLYDYIEKDGKADFEDIKEIKSLGKKSFKEIIYKLISIGLLKQNLEGLSEVEFELAKKNEEGKLILQTSVERKTVFNGSKKEEELENVEFIGEIRIEDLDFSVKAYNGLCRAGIRTVKDLYDYIEKDGKVNVKVFTKKVLNEVIEKMISIGVIKKRQLQLNDIYLNHDKISDDSAICNSEITLDDLYKSGIHTVKDLISSGFFKKNQEGDIEIQQNVLYQEIENLNFSVKVYNNLKLSGINTVKDLYDRIKKDGEVNFEELKKIKNFGKNSLNEVTDRLISIGILKTDQENEFELQPDVLNLRRHSISEVEDAVSDLTSSQVFGTLKGVNETVQKSNSEQTDEKKVDEED